MFDKLGNKIEVGNVCVFHKGDKNAELEIGEVLSMTDKTVKLRRGQYENWAYHRKPNQVVVIKQ